MTKKPNILFVASWYPNKNKPFLGNFIQRHAEAFTTTGHHVHVFHINKDCSNHFHVEQNTQGQITSTIAYINPGNSILGKLRSVPQRLRAYLVLAYLYAQCQICHIHVLRDVAFMMAILHWRNPKSLFITEHSTYYLGDNFSKPASLTWRAMRYLAKKAKYILPVTAHLGEAMLSQGLIGNYAILENVVDTQLFHIHSNKEVQPFTFIHVSTLIPEHKNPSGMIQAFHEAYQQNPNIRFEIITDEDPSEAQQLVKKLQLGQAVTISGPLQIQEVAEAIGTANCMVLFSNYENFPCVIAESWATGIPVISTKVGGIHEHLNTTNGYIFNKGDEAALSNAMLAIAQSPTKFDAQELRQYAENNFSYTAIGKKLLDYYGLK